ncbi:MAG: glycosyl transferase [Lachnospiraceae bacterium]|nr:glycosyl transferase [Lachnospiraceae bacterium]
MIPKIIHFCWLSGDEYPDLIKKCINSWKEKLPDYEIICWDLNRFDINKYRYTKEAFAEKKYAFASDYIRLHALYTMGGIYLDSDIEVIKSFDQLLSLKAFTCFQKMSMTLSPWIIGSEKTNPIIKEFLDYYKDRSFYDKEGKMILTPNPYPFTKICKSHGLLLKDEMQELDEITVFPHDYFCPYNPSDGELKITEHTYAIHYFNAEWMNESQKRRRQRKQNITQKYGRYAGLTVYAWELLKEEGPKELYKEFYHFFVKR